jgi:hypothetical protein
LKLSAVTINPKTTDYGRATDDSTGRSVGNNGNQAAFRYIDKVIGSIGWAVETQE